MCAGREWRGSVCVCVCEGWRARWKDCGYPLYSVQGVPSRLYPLSHPPTPTLTPCTSAHTHARPRHSLATPVHPSHRTPAFPPSSPTASRCQLHPARLRRLPARRAHITQPTPHTHTPSGRGQRRRVCGWWCGVCAAGEAGGLLSARHRYTPSPPGCQHRSPSVPAPFHEASAASVDVGSPRRIRPREPHSKRASTRPPASALIAPPPPLLSSLHAPSAGPMSMHCIP